MAIMASIAASGPEVHTSKMQDLSSAPSVAGTLLAQVFLAESMFIELHSSLAVGGFFTTTSGCGAGFTGAGSTLICGLGSGAGVGF